MILTKTQLQAIMPSAKPANIDLFLQPLCSAMVEFDITTKARMAYFLAQIAHESGCLKYREEIADGSAYDVGQQAINLGNTPEDDGDGERTKGRGLIQTTGTRNYKLVGKALKGDEMFYIKNPDKLEEPEDASRSAAYFWKSNKLNEIADLPESTMHQVKIKGVVKKTVDNFEWASVKVNGFNQKINAPNGLDDRIRYFKLAKQTLGL